MRRLGGSFVLGRLVLALGAVAVAGTVFGQESPRTPPAPARERASKTDAASRLSVSILSAHDIAVVKSADEYSIFVRGDGHLSIETEPDKVKPGLDPRAAERTRIDIRAEDTVAFVPAEKDGLAPDPNRLSTSVRALYCEGHVAFVQETIKGLAGKRTSPAFRLEARQLYIDLVHERIYAVDAVATLPAGTKRAPNVGASSSAGATSKNVVSQQATFTLRAERLRLRGADEVVAENASLSICDFGLPHEAIEGERITLQAVEKRKFPHALNAAGSLGGIGATYIGWRAERGLPFRAFREISRSTVGVKEGSDAIAHTERDPRKVTIEGAELRARPPFLGDDGVGVPFPLTIPWETDWLFPEIRIGHSSKFGYFGAAELKVPLIRPDVVYERPPVIRPDDPNMTEAEKDAELERRIAKAEKSKENGDRQIQEGLELDAIAAGAYYQDRGPATDPGFTYAYRDAQGHPVFKGMLRGFYIDDHALEDRNGTPIPAPDRYWLRGVHQQDLNPVSAVTSLAGSSADSKSDSPADHVKLDAEISKQSDPDLLYEYYRGAAYSEKEQETYVYLRRAWDDLGARFISRWRLNDFQTQTEQLPSARFDALQAPLLVTDRFGGAYLTVGVEGANLRTRNSDLLVPQVPDQRVGRGDFDARLDYKLPIANLLYVDAFAEGRYTAWSQSSDSSGAIDREIGATGVHLGSQADGEAPVAENLWLRHVIQPEVGFYDRYYVSKQPEQLIPVDDVDSYRQGEYVYLRLRNRIQYASDGEGKKAHDLLDVTVEDRYYPTNERLNPNTRMWDTLLGDSRLYFGNYGNLRTEIEMDPTRHRVLRFESTITLLASRTYRAIVEGAKLEDAIQYPDVNCSIGYHDVLGLTRSVTWAFDVRLTASWGFRVEEIFDFEQHSFLQHRIVLTRRFHNWALEGTGSYDPFLHDTSFTFSVLPLLEDEDHDPFREGLLRNTSGQ